MSTEQDILAANLACLRAVNPTLADRLDDASPAVVEWSASRSGPLCASVDHRGRTQWLASRYDPDGEAEKLTSKVDISKHACVVVQGIGLGYHVSLLAKQLHDTQNVMVVYEPDVRLLRAVLERSTIPLGWVGQISFWSTTGLIGPR